MKSRYLAFDIETSKDVPGEDFNWKPYRPLGIACAATLTSDNDSPLLWHGKNPDGSPAAKMTQSEARELVQYLLKMQADGYKILTWNGLHFDFDVLSEESSDLVACKEVALNHVDMMFHVFCSQGYPISLEKTAQGMRLPGKPAGMSGVKAPKLWAEGQHEKVLEYVAQDVRVAMQIANACEQRHCLEWIARRGTLNSMPLGSGWLTVQEALRLPEPDTSWMSAPIPRSDFTGWLTRI